MLADPMAVVAFVLSALGAGGVIRPAVGAVSRTVEEWRRRRETRETPREFYYRSCSAALRIVEADRKYVHRREACLVSRDDKLTRVPWGSRFFGDVEVVDEHLGCDHPSIRLSLVEADSSVDRGEGWNRRYLQLSKPLRRREEIEFVHCQTLAATGRPLERILRWSPQTRCDRITLTVAFASDPPRQVRYSAHTHSGEEIKWCYVPLDVITGSFTQVVDDPMPGRSYKLAW